MIHERLIHENETGIPGERLLIQSFLSVYGCDQQQEALLPTSEEYRILPA